MQSFNEEMTSSCLPLDNQLSLTLVLHCADFTPSARTNWRCLQRTCKPNIPIAKKILTNIYFSFTRDQVPVSLTIYLKWCVFVPTKHTKFISSNFDPGNCWNLLSLLLMGTTLLTMLFATRHSLSLRRSSPISTIQQW